MVYAFPNEYSVFVTKVCSLFTIPVTSPIPIVVAFAPIVRVLLPISSIPWVLDGLALCKLRIPFTVQLQHALIPAPLMVKLLMLLTKIDSGHMIVEVFISTIVADELLASIFPLTLMGAFPEIVKEFAPKVKVPEVNINVPATFTDPPKLIPFARFSVKLLSNTPGNVVLAPLPPILILLVPPPVKVPAVAETEPFSVNVFAPIEKAPLVSESAVWIVTAPFCVRPLLLFKVSPSMVLLTNAPAGILCAAVPAKMTTDEAAVASTWLAVAEIKLPVRVN